VRRLLTVAALPVVLAAALVGVTGAQHAMAAPLAGQGCILGIVCIPSPSSPTPTPSASSDSPTAGAPSSSPSPTSPGQPTASSGSSAPASAAPSADAGPTPSASGSPSPSGTAATKPAQKHAAATPGLVAAASPAVLTAGTANIAGFHYVGNVDVPIAGGTQTMMKFTAASIDLSGNVTVTVTQDGTTVTTVSATQDFGDGVTLYATRLSGTVQAVPGLPGVPLTLSPSTIGVSLLKLPNAGLLQLANPATGAIPLTLTGVTTDQLLISGGTQVTTQLSMGNGRS
jgi:hypothetical protein